jgi:hypothetical protein
MPTTDLMHALGPTSVSFTLDYGQETSGQASGQIIVKDLRSPIWRMKVDCGGLDIRRLRVIRGLIDALGGSRDSFYAWDPASQFPAADPNGSILGTSNVQIGGLGGDSKSLWLKGAPPGYVLTVGDLLAFDFNGRRALHQVGEASVAANGSGVTPVFGITPHLRQGATINAAVALVRPAAEMRIIPGTLDLNVTGWTGQCGFEAMQVV